MSRLRALTIPFVQGQNDAIAKEILPDGVLARVVDGRFNKAGELALRRGWRQVTMTDTLGVAVTARDLYSFEEALVALREDQDGSGELTLATYQNPAGARPWYGGMNLLSPATHVRAIGGIPDLRVFANRVSLALTTDGAYGCTFQQAPASSETHFRLFRVDTDETLAFGQSAQPSNPAKVVGFDAAGFRKVDNTGTALRLQTASVAFDGLFGSSVTLVSVTATAFDVAVATESAPTHLHVAWVSGGNVSYGKFTGAGVQVGSTKTVVSGGVSSHVAVASDDTYVHVAYQNAATGVVSVLSFLSATLAGDVGPTVVFGSEPICQAHFDVVAVPAAGSGTFGGAGASAVVGQDLTATTGGPAEIHLSTLTPGHVVATRTRRGAMLSGGLVVRDRRVGYGYSRDNAIVYGDADQVWFVLHGLGNDIFDGAASAFPPYEPGQTAGGLYLVAGQTPARQPVVRAFTLDTIQRRQGAVMAGALYVTGGTMTKWSHTEVAEDGLLAPVLETATPSNSTGNLTPSGVYKYRAMLRWKDSQDSEHEGEVSVEEEVTLGASDDTVTLSYAIPPSLARSADLIGSAVLEVYRTEAGPGELFYLTATEATLSTTNDLVTIVDTTPDSSLIDERRLYTEGEFGATSGRLDNVFPRPGTYVAATRDRLVSGSSDAEYQVSQLSLASEPVAFTDPGVSGPIALVYFDQVDRDLTAVAALDDTIVLGTARGLFVTSGDGPNFAGVGEFASPSRLPSNVGVYDWRSVLETAEGLWFLGDSDKLYALARGEAVPVWAGEAVRDALAGPVVGAALDTLDHVATWAVDVGGDSTLLVRDLRLGVWSTDSMPFTPRALVAHQGYLWAVSSAGQVWVQAPSVYGDGPGSPDPTARTLLAETGDAQVFGLGGQGRLAVVEIEGVFYTAAALTCSISYDQGVTWTSLGTDSVGSGLTAGAPFQSQFYPARQRGGKFRVRVEMTPTVGTTEGCRLTGLTISHTVRGGPSRLPSARRR